MAACTTLTIETRLPWQSRAAVAAMQGARRLGFRPRTDRIIPWLLARGFYYRFNGRGRWLWLPLPLSQ